MKHLHRECFVCGDKNPMGLGLQFFLTQKGDCEAQFSFPSHVCGYPNRVQGGIVSAVLDSSMANALLLRGIVAYTAKLHVRFTKPVLPLEPCVVIAKTMGNNRSIHSLEAALFQNNVRVASASASFFEVESKEEMK